MQKHTSRRGWGRIRKLPSGRVQAGYTGPDEQVHYAPVTFQARIDAEAWLAAEHRMVELDTWTPPSQRAVQDDPEITIGEYAESWLDSRDLKPRTRFHYERMIDRLIKPAFGDRHLDEVTPVMVKSWHSGLLPGRPTMRAHTYSLLRTVLSAAIEEQLIATNPCTVKGAGSSKRVHQIEPATTEELNAIVAAMPERYRVAVLLAAWCALRFGELIELRRGDIDVKRGVVKVRRAVVQVTGGRIVGTPKSTAGIRDVTVPPHVRDAVQNHLDKFVGKAKDALVMPGASGSTSHDQCSIAASKPQPRPRDGPTYAGTISDTRVLCSLPRPVPPFPNS